MNETEWELGWYQGGCEVTTQHAECDIAHFFVDFEASLALWLWSSLVFRNRTRRHWVLATCHAQGSHAEANPTFMLLFYRKWGPLYTKWTLSGCKKIWNFFFWNFRILERGCQDSSVAHVLMSVRWCPAFKQLFFWMQSYQLAGVCSSSVGDGEQLKKIDKVSTSVVQTWM